MKKSIYIILFALFIFLFAAPEKSFGCSCIASPDPVKKQIQSAFIGSDAIFSGEVIEVKESPTDKYNFVVKFKVNKSWKDETSQEITINTARESAMCGYNFEIGKTYIVYAAGTANNLSVNNCSRTMIFSNKGDAKYLDKLKRRKLKSV